MGLGWRPSVRSGLRLRREVVVDMNLSPAWVDLLATGGHEAVHWRDVGTMAASDEEIIAWATAEQRVVLTADRDFAAAVAIRGLSAPTVVQLRSGSTDPRDVGPIVLRSIDAAGIELAGAAILTIDRGSARLRAGLSRSFPMNDA